MDLGGAKRSRSPSAASPGDPLGPFPSLGKDLAPQGETLPLPPQAAKSPSPGTAGATPSPRRAKPCPRRRCGESPQARCRRRQNLSAAPGAASFPLKSQRLTLLFHCTIIQEGPEPTAGPVLFRRRMPGTETEYRGQGRVRQHPDPCFGCARTLHNRKPASYGSLSIAHSLCCRKAVRRKRRDLGGLLYARRAGGSDPPARRFVLSGFRSPGRRPPLGGGRAKRDFGTRDKTRERVGGNGPSRGVSPISGL